MRSKVRSRETPRTNIREAPSSFIGRAADIAAIARIFEGARLVTITGPGGMGKTRLALRFASDALTTLAPSGAGAWLCDLVEARTVSDIIEAVAAALGTRLVGLDDDDSADAVGRAIARKRRVLVVVDNFDRLTDRAAPTIGRWMQAAPEARFLVTSRIPLELAGEHLWPLAPLPRDEAVELFLRRACERMPDVDELDARAIVESVVDRCDRIPLAIELAATRAGVIPVKELHDRLKSPLDVLAAQRSFGRHSSMRDVVMDSVNRLPEAARQLFIACASFRNGFTLEAAEAVATGPAIERSAVLDGLGTLVASSLLRSVFEPQDDVARFSLFETIREVARELAANDPDEDARAGRHATYYATLVARLATGGGAPGRGAALGRDLENVLDAHATAVRLAGRDGDASRAKQAVAIAVGLEPLLAARGLSRLRARLFDDARQALESVGAAGTVVGAEALLGRGFARRELGESRLAFEDFERALQIATEAGDGGLSALALTRLGELCDLAGDTERARGHFGEALILLRREPEDATRAAREAEVYLADGHARRREGSLDEAHAACVMAAERNRALRNDERLASTMYELAVIEMLRERSTEAFAHFEEGLAVAERGGARVIVGALTTARGSLLQDLGRLDEARDHHAEAARIFQETGSRYRETSALYYLASTHVERGDPRTAVSILERAMDRLEGVGAKRYVALTSGCLAISLSALGRVGEAERSMARAEAAGALVRAEAALSCNLEIHRMTLSLRASEMRDAETVIASARALVRAASSDDSRFAFRALFRAAHGADGSSDALVVGEAGSSFRVPGSREAVTLPVRSPLRRIVEHLAKLRIDAPGEAASLADIIRVGWPSEKIGAAAAQNRAYVALATLRKQGLRAILSQANGGYLFSPTVSVRFAASSIKAD